MIEPHDQTTPKEDNETTARRIRAAQCDRISTEYQQYSTDNQQDTIREYAAQRGFEIIQTYADEGKSGLNVAGRRSQVESRSND